jgi:DNA (cytosine-5)-methyltransferase 1
MGVTATDLFCGAGGSSIGFELAGGELRLGLNHWQRAIETHAANFQHADHDCEDVASLTTAQIRRYPDSDILMASPECTNHSLAKGAQRKPPQPASLFDDGPAGDAEQERSRATMWDVVRFAEQKLRKGRPYKAIVVENVVDAFKWGYNDDGGLFSAWRQAVGALGYEHEIVFLNSMFCPPTPQSRDRMYVVFWLRGMRRPDLRFEPRSWCPKCTTLVDGRQTWKRLDRTPWGRYGVQYYYGCPVCSGTVLPGVFPAASIIDRSLPAPLIGDRARPLAKNTRERIRRGLERLAREPFAIRLTHGGTPKPMTLPIVTLTARHDMAMVTPVAANTFERTPGNRAKDASTTPLPTVHGTLSKALVIPPMGQVDGRDADAQPLPTQTTTTRAALVIANTENNVPRPAEDLPAQTLHNEGGLALVYSNRAKCLPHAADRTPAPTVCTGGHLNVIVRNNNSRGEAGQMCTPDHEPIRTLTTSGHQSLVVPYDRTARGHAADRESAPTLTTKDRLSLVVPAGGSWASAPTLGHEPLPTQTGTESRAVVWADDDIDACGFRMFALHEIAAAMAMTDHPHGGDYEVIGNKRERMAQYGNAVTPPVMEQIVSRLFPILDEATA